EAEIGDGDVALGQARRPVRLLRGCGGRDQQQDQDCEQTLNRPPFPAIAAAQICASKPTRRRSPRSSTGRLIIDGCSSISATAFSASSPALAASGSWRKVVPARFSTFSQPSSAAQARSRGSSIPALL